VSVLVVMVPGYTRHGKWAVLKPDAFVFAHRVLDWCCENETDFIPDAAMPLLAGSGPRGRRLALELEQCGAHYDPPRPGLLVRVDGGWRFHDFWDYPKVRLDDLERLAALAAGEPPPASAPSTTPPPKNAARAAAGRLGGLRSAAARLEANGTAQPKQTPKQNTEAAEASSKQSSEAKPGSWRSNLSGSSEIISENPESPLPPAVASEANEQSPDEAKPDDDPDDKKSGTTEAKDAERAQVLEVFEFWKQDTGHAGAFLDRKRGRRILSRLRENKTVEDLKQAIRNRRNDPHLMGTSVGGDGKVYDGIETLLRDNGQVERLMALKEPLRAPQKAQPPGLVAHHHAKSEDAEARRLRRNTVYENAKAGRYGPDARRRIRDNDRVRELIDELEFQDVLPLQTGGARV
jgi:hypothetical protein